jgi:hypothetical protein
MCGFRINYDAMALNTNIATNIPQMDSPNSFVVARSLIISLHQLRSILTRKPDCRL